MSVLAGAAAAQSPAAGAADPFAWMEEIEGERPVAWARAENARSLGVLKSDPRFDELHADALAVLTAKDRIPGVRLAGDGSLRNFWQDAEHVRGLWRATDVATYRTDSPNWRTILDLDALAKSEGANWVWHGTVCLPPDETRCLLALSDGGKDADVVREFDVSTRTFVEGGFRLPEGKHRYGWLDRDTLVVATEWETGQVTTSGYPFVVKVLKRGQALTEAKEVFRGAAGDGGYGVTPIPLHDPDGRLQAVLFSRPLDTFNAEHHLLTDGGPVKLPLPMRATLQGYVDGQVVFSLEENWTARGFKEGDLVSIDLAALKADPQAPRPVLALRPTQSQAIEQVATTRNRLVVALYENVKGQVVSLERVGEGWRQRRLELPSDVSVGIQSASDYDDSLVLSVQGYLTPPSLWLADAANGPPERLKAQPARFDASNLTVEQFWATSKDGTKVPYFVVRRADLPFDGAAPTLLYAYGGFQVSMTPSYSGVLGKLWLERGGVYVLANIRGGGEFGPRWHTAGLKQNRQRVYDDFFAVSEDLIARKITSPRRLGIMGGSNGGLLMGVALTQRPELYNAVVIQVPLFDMIGYTHIGAGASWVGEYGDPADPEERKVIETYSPYQRLAPGKPYPEVFIETSTKDDRVHPAHARKAAARLKALGYPYLYYENIDGGHAAAANLNEAALRQALEYTYLTRRLMD